MKNGWFLILFLGALVLNFSCSRSMGCGDPYGNEYERQNKEGRTLAIIKFSEPVFFNNDFSFDSMPGQPAPKNNHFKYPGINPRSISSNFPSFDQNFIALPPDREEYSFIINYKDSIRDTLFVSYKVALNYYEDNVCYPSYHYLDVDILNYRVTGNFVNILYLYENY